MNGEGGTHVSTDGGAHGAVAGTIHGGVHNYYQVPEGATAEEKLEFARNYLASGQATTARKLMREVSAEIRDSNEVWFVWMLAFFSGRTLWELSAEDRESWTAAGRQIDGLPRDYWSPGIDAIRRLAEASRTGAGAGAASAALRDINLLDGPLRSEILRHLERVLRGSLKDELWDQEVAQARAERLAERRRDRVWKFFEPAPAEPRAGRVRGPDYSGGHLALAVLGTAVVAAALGTIGWLALRRDDTSALVALTVTVIAAGTAMVNGAEWRFRVDQVHAEERWRRAARFPSPQARPRGFAATVDRMYTRYARQCGEKGAEREAWLLDAYLPLCRLRDELVEIYREERVKADRIKWLIRFQVRELYRQWADGTMVGPRQRWAVSPQVKALAGIGALVGLIATVWAVQAAAREDLVYAAEAMIAMMFGAWVAVPLWLRIVAENRRFAVEKVDQEQRLTTYYFEFQRWRHWLSDRPGDIEMAKWLECDRRILLEHAMRMYQLNWSDISAYASLEAPATGSRKARAKNGPWRYSRYRLLVFLLTVDGVRQVTVELDFGQAAFNHWERTNYRYDAVAAVQVTVEDDGARDLRLFLLNGADITVAVTEPGGAGQGEDRRVLADGAQDATGLRNTLFVLEGVAAEGRRWWKGSAYRRAG